MEKLELKHIAPYLPYNVKLMFKGKDIDRLSFKKYYILKEIQEGFICVNGYRTNNKSYLPILRPIEELYDSSTDFGIKIVHYFNFRTNVKLDCKNFPYHVMEQLFKNHFDVFGLIEKGLAVSYSDVESSSNEG
jgi:hypothetical protein